jgi:hypothetical protein
MHLSFYNVGFGDSSILVGDKENLLIDLGSDFNCFDFEPIWKDIYSECKEKDLIVMCSHFHDDHINGIIKHDKGSKTISEVIIPNFLSIPLCMEYSFTELSIYQAFFESVIINKKIKLSIYDLLKFLCENNTKVRFVQAENKFVYDNSEYRVLWPNPHHIELINDNDLDTINYINEKFDEKEYDNTDEKTHLTLLEQNGLRGFIRKIAGNIDKLYMSLNITNNNDFMSQIETVEDVGRDLEKLERLSNAIGLVDKDGIKKFTRKFKIKQNELSIVFHNDQYLPDRNILFTGDVTSVLFDNYIYAFLHKEYNVIKAPHHGTFNLHFTYKLPISNNILISNGNNSHPRYGKISIQYGCYYNAFQNPKFKVICTNTKCEMKEKGHVCKYDHQCGFKLKTVLCL